MYHCEKTAEFPEERSFVGQTFTVCHWLPAAEYTNKRDERKALSEAKSKSPKSPALVFTVSPSVKMEAKASCKWNKDRDRLFGVSMQNQVT